MSKSLAFIFFFFLPLFACAQHTIVVKPSQSIEKAVQKARKMQGEKTILLREGRHELPATLVLTEEDSGLTIKAWPGEKAELTGSKRLKGLKWEAPLNLPAGGSPQDTPAIYKSILKSLPLSGGAEGELSGGALLVNESFAHLARYPNFSPSAVRFGGTSADATSPERIARWQNPAGGFLHAMHQSDWGDFHYRIKGKNADGTLALEGGHQNNRRMGIHRDNRMVEGIFEELDADGEFFIEASRKVDNLEASKSRKPEFLLFYFPRPGEDLATATFDVPLLKHLIELRGTKRITIEGLTLTGTTRTFMEPYEPLLRSDWTVYRGGAILLEGTEDCAIKNCDLRNLGGNAIFFSRYNRRSSVTGCHITDIGASAVLFVGDPSAVRSPSFEYGESVPLSEMDFGFGPKNDLYPEDCTVSDNLIHHIGLFEKQITGVELSMCRAITVSHNSIYDVPRAGINVSEGTWGGHVIEHNDIFDTVKETGDHGSFNSWGRDRFWHPVYEQMCRIVAEHPTLALQDVTAPIQILHNRFRCDRGWDIDLDDGSSNYIIRDNLCLNGGIKLREGSFRTVENNILVNNTFHPHVWWQESSDVFRNNIVMTPYQPINLRGWGTEIDRNIFSTAAALEKARRNGTDQSSVCAAINFESPAEGDFRIKESSIDVFRTGFHNFPMDNFGVQSPRLKVLARQPQMPQIIQTSPSREGKAGEGLIVWHGVTVKNLETLGERSATGMDSERGVYVVSLQALGCPLRDYLQPNDVILSANNRKTDRLTDLPSEGEAVRTLIIFRNQHEQTINIK